MKKYIYLFDIGCVNAVFTESMALQSEMTKCGIWVPYLYVNNSWLSEREIFFLALFQLLNNFKFDLIIAAKYVLSDHEVKLDFFFFALLKDILFSFLSIWR